jgi:hypothetical protein
MAGNGHPDLIVTSPNAAHVFRNETSVKDDRFAEPGSQGNFTLY